MAAILEQISDLAKNVSQKTTDAIEITKMTAKINMEKASIEKEYKKLGKYYYKKHATDACLEDEIQEQFQAIRERMDTIARMEEELEQLKTRIHGKDFAGRIVAICPYCGHGNPSGEQFCNECGENMEIKDKTICPSCGMPNKAAASFCNDCGASLREEEGPDVQACKICGRMLEDGVKFCGRCGARAE